MIDWEKTPDPPISLVPAAEYVRMSTEHQRYSTDNQQTAIQRYAEKRGYRIVRTFADEGKSGLRLDGRDALKQLLRDVESRTAGFKAILVYDVSRWGRFQDPDEAAAIELSCKKAGIAVHYCAEQFENDGSIGSSIIKTVKRAMAGEYSRELSVKVFAGQSNLIRLGFRQGGPAGFGLRRLLVDQNGEPKGELARGEHKSITTDRVILIPGPPEEIDVVREVYRLFIEERRTEGEIAGLLNERGLVTDLRRPWTRGTVHQLLINEKYIGNNVWGRTSFKLKQARQENAPEDWIRSDGVFQGIIEPERFMEAQAIIAARSARLTDEQMLERLADLLQRHGSLSGIIIDESEECPSSSAFRSRFGSLLRAYTLVGFSPAHDYRYLEINRTLRRMHPEVVAGVIEGIRAAGGRVLQDGGTDLLWVNGEFTASLVIVRCRPTMAGSLRWHVRLDRSLRPDLTIAVRMDSRNEHPLDFYLLPKIDVREAVVRLCEYNGLSRRLPLHFPGQALRDGAAGGAAEGGMTEATPAQQVEMIPIDRVVVVNPRVRNRRIFNEIVESIALVGLKRPITVTRRQDGEETFYDLVCGQGRVEACRTLGYDEVPALVVTADQEDCLVSSLVENCARRQHRALDLLHDIGAMAERGYNIESIARKTGLSYEYVSGVSRLLRRGEERLLRAVESGAIPITVAVDIADCDDTEIQGALQSAYEQNLLKGRKLVAARRLVELRRRRGKGLRVEQRNRRPLSTQALVKAYEEDTQRKQDLIRRSELAKARLSFITEAIRSLIDDDGFFAILEEEELITVPANLAARIPELVGAVE